MRHRFLLHLAVVSLIGFLTPVAPSSAGVRIDMPAPVKKPAATPASLAHPALAQPSSLVSVNSTNMNALLTSVAPSATVVVTAAAEPTVGSIALARYARARIGTSDNYTSYSSGSRHYISSYPCDNWGWPIFWGGWGWSFNSGSCSNHSNTVSNSCD